MGEPQVRVDDRVWTTFGEGTVVRIRNEAERSHHKEARFIEVRYGVNVAQLRWFTEEEVQVI